MTMLRARYDSWTDAGRWRAILLGAVPDPRLDLTTRWAPDFLSFLDHHEEAKVGDVWTFRRNPVGPDIVHSYANVSERPDRAHWPVAYYALVCPVPTCKEGVHSWEHAHDCPAGDRFAANCKRGPGRLSCWDWTGSIEAHNLGASPSLQVVTEIDGRKLNTCGFHGHLKEGVLA